MFAIGDRNICRFPIPDGHSKLIANTPGLRPCAPCSTGGTCASACPPTMALSSWSTAASTNSTRSIWNTASFASTKPVAPHLPMKPLRFCAKFVPVSNHVIWFETIVGVRLPVPTEPKIRFGAFELDRQTGELYQNGAKLKLQGQPIAVLSLLLEHPGELVTREQIRQHLWPEDTFVDFEHSLNTHIKKLRQVLDDNADTPRYIETLPRRGYRFIAAVDTPIVPHQPKPPDPEPGPPKPPWWRRKSTISVAVCIAMAGAFYPLIAPPIERLRRQRELQQLKAVPLTSLPGTVTSPTFSPDGSQVAFIWWRDNPVGYGQLYVKVVGNDIPLLLTRWPVGVNAVSAAWSPDGRNIAVCRAAGTADDAVYLISPLGGSERKITSTSCGAPFIGSGLSWSADGKRLAFLHPAADDSTELFVLSLDSSEPVPISTNCKKVILPAFSPRGDYLAWACADTQEIIPVYLKHLSDGRVSEIVRSKEVPGGLAWSGDGRRLVFSSGHESGDLWEVALSRPNRPEKLPFGHDAGDLAVSFNGHRLTYEQLHTNTNIWRLDLSHPQAPAQKLVASSRGQTAPNYSPDGTKIAFMSSRSGNWEIWVSDSDGSNALQLSSFGIRSTGTPRWSPDGKLIAFDSRIGAKPTFTLSIRVVECPTNSTSMWMAIMRQAGRTTANGSTL